MPVYGSLGPTAIVPGDNYVLFNGTETPASGTKSIAIARAEGAHDTGVMTFTVQFASSPTATVSIEASNVDADASYQTIYAGAGTQQDYYADLGGFAFYRANLSAYTSGGMPTVIVQR